jgi:hypothetical protein
VSHAPGLPVVHFVALLITGLAAYIKVLAESADATQYAEARPKYESHLAAAARMFAELHGNRPDELRRLVNEERHSYGWAFLSGNEGARAEGAFTALAAAIDRVVPKS